MDAWSTDDSNYLLAGESGGWLERVEQVELPDGTRIGGLRAAEHLLVNSEGVVLKSYSAPYDYAYGDDYYVLSIHAVVGDELLEASVRDHEGISGYTARAQVVLSGLRGCGVSDLPFDPERVLARQERANAAKRESAQTGAAYGSQVRAGRLRPRWLRWLP